MAPPAKRRKRNIVEASEDEDEEKPQANTLTNFLFSSPNSRPSTTPAASRGPTASPSPIKAKPRIANASHSANISSHLSAGNGLPKRGAKSPSTSPEKNGLRGAKRAKIEEKGRTADLVTLFSKQAQKASTASTTATKSLPVDDPITDPISEDDVAEQKASSSSIVGQNARKRFKESAQSGTPTTVTSSQKFLKPPRPAKSASLDDDLRPWSERFAPLSLDELAVHKKKVADVRRWLDDVLSGRMRQRLLLLKGAAGSGKTTTMRLLARELGCELLEWHNPTGALGTGVGFQSASAQFREFLGRGGKFGQLDTDDTGSGISSSAVDPSSKSAPRIILIEEFPNTFARSSTALTSFRSALQGYLATNTPALSTFGRQRSNDPITPVVMVVSETLLTTTSASADSFTAHRLLGPEILRHPGVGVIEFNTVAPTIVAKALELVVLKEARKSGRKRTPGPLVLKQLGEIGDIRNAIASLEFLCLKGDQDADWGAKVAFTKPKKGANGGIALTKGETESLELISQREASLGIFHAVGKVVYNKREELPPPDNTVECLPSYIRHHSRPKRSQVAVDTLIDETGTDTHTFISALHENYMLSCERPSPLDPSSSLDYVSGCIEYLSESDLLSPAWDIFFGRKGFSGSFAGKDSGSHILRQDEITFQVAVRGMLFSLPIPVKRKTSTGTKGTDAFKMFYPTYLKLWRTKEEFEGLVDVWSTKLLKGEETLPRKNLTDGAVAFRKPQQGSTGSWMNNQRPNKPATTSTRSEPEQSDSTPLLSLGSAARREMLLERLPYMAQIVRGRKGAFSSLRLKDIEKVVSFQGIGVSTEDSGDEEDDNLMMGEAWATDKPSEESSPRKKGAAIRTKSDGLMSGLRVQNLVLSDDDIEDD